MSRVKESSKEWCCTLELGTMGSHYQPRSERRWGGSSYWDPERGELWGATVEVGCFSWGTQ